MKYGSTCCKKWNLKLNSGFNITMCISGHWRFTRLDYRSDLRENEDSHLTVTGTMATNWIYTFPVLFVFWKISGKNFLVSLRIAGFRLMLSNFLHWIFFTESGQEISPNTISKQQHLFTNVKVHWWIFDLLQNGCFLNYSTAASFFLSFTIFLLSTLQHYFSYVSEIDLWYLRFLNQCRQSLKLICRVEAKFRRSLFWIWLEPSCIRIRLLFKTAMPLWGENNKKTPKSWVEICNGDSAFNPVVCRSHELPLMHTEAYRERFWVFHYAFIKTVFLILCEGKLIQPC